MVEVITLVALYETPASDRFLTPESDRGGRIVSSDLENPRPHASNYTLLLVESPSKNDICFAN